METPNPSLTLHLEQIERILPKKLRHPSVMHVIQASLAEDLDPDSDFARIWPFPAVGDITSQATLVKDKWLEGQITSKADGILAGLPVAQAVCMLVDPQITFKSSLTDSSPVSSGDVIAAVSGPGPALLAAERPMLNFIGRMSGIATLTNRYVQAVAGTESVILDTRKTAPGLRHLDKYAVRMGGGQNHRSGLYDMVLIKDNHIDGAGGIVEAVNLVRQNYGHTYLIEVEVKNLEELKTALTLNVDRIMLDNMGLSQLREAVTMTAGKVELEASGNVTLDTIRAIADTGVNFISSGALTHSVLALDISMRLRYH